MRLACALVPQVRKTLYFSPDVVEYRVSWICPTTPQEMMASNSIHPTFCVSSWTFRRSKVYFRALRKLVVGCRRHDLPEVQTFSLRAAQELWEEVELTTQDHRRAFSSALGFCFWLYFNTCCHGVRSGTENARPRYKSRHTR